MNWADVGMLAIFLSGSMAIFTRSYKLSLFVFLYLIGIWGIQSFFSELHAEGKLTMFPSVPVIVFFQWYCLYVLENSHIKAKITPLVIGFAMIFESVMLVERLLGFGYFVGYFGMVIGLTSLLASMEGMYYGGSFRFTKSGSTGERSGGFGLSWLLPSIQAHKEK